MNSIRRRLNLTLSTALVLLLGGGMALLYFGLHEALTEQFDHALTTRLQDLDATIARGEMPRAPSVDRPRRHGPAPWARFSVVRDGTGAVIASDAPGAENLPTPQLRHRPVYWQVVLPTGHEARAAGMESRSAGPNGPYQLIVGADLDELDEELRAVLAGIVLAGIAMVLVTVWLVSRTLRRELRPLDVLAGAAAGIEAHSLDRRFPTAGLPAELQPIASRLNDLLARLQHSFARERRVSADLAHELRTPLAELRLAAETALKWPEARPADTDRDVLEIVKQMESLIGQMLQLARSEDGTLPLSRAAVDLPALIDNVWRGFAPRAAERRLRVEFALTPAEVQSDPVLLRSIVTNLIENAVEYAPEGGTIHLACETDAAGQAGLCVSNAVIGLTSDDVARLFERFWRKEAARSDRAHFGLGLAISQAFAQALGWHIAAQLERPDWLKVILREKRPAGPAT